LALGIEAGMAQAGDELPAVVPPGDRFGDPVHLQRVEPERFPDVAQRALGLIGDERGRQRSALAAVFAIDVLDDFLAPLVPDIDVDFEHQRREEVIQYVYGKYGRRSCWRKPCASQSAAVS